MHVLQCQRFLRQTKHILSLIDVKMSSDPVKPNVLVTRCDFSPSAIALLKEHFEVECWDNKKNGLLPQDKFIKLIRGKFGVMMIGPLRVDEDVLAAGVPSLRVVSTASVGVDHVEVEIFKKYNVRLGYAPHVSNLEATAELTVALLLAVSRRIVEASNGVKSGGWTPDLLANHWVKGQGLYDSTIGIIGYGRIGHSVAVKLKSFSPKQILYYSRKEKPNGAEIGAVFTDLDTLLQTCDFIILTILATPETKGLISREKISLMKRNAIFINTARGVLVDQDALTEALQQGKILGAGLDVTSPEPLPLDHPLHTLKNCVILPHMGDATSKGTEDKHSQAAKNIIAVWKGAPMPAEYPL
nr:PREDICTED: glyoxylate reductase/hydroxypyruvate reductase-like [Bemisia tabaci]